MPGPIALPDWRRALDAGRIAARIRTTPDDFQVTEALAFEPDGDGEHDYLWLEKRDANTAWVARGLARFAGVPLNDVGYSGLKDRHALTRQWFSVRRRPGRAADWRELKLPGVVLLGQQRHSRKLKRGAHRGNAFRIVLRGLRARPDALAVLLDTAGSRGVPNYFGEQRFGREARNLELARRLFDGARLKREQRSIAISAARSLLFNELLSQRVQDGSWERLVPGDLASLDGSGSVFAVTDAPDRELERRCRELDIHPSGPLWGRGEPGSGGAVADLERRVAERYPELRAGLERHAGQSRRALRLAVRDFGWARHGDTLRLEFFLMRGGYATAVLREIADCADVSAMHGADRA